MVFRVKRTGPSGLGDLGDGIYRKHTQRAVRERTAHLSTWQRPKQDSCLANNSIHCFIVPLTC